MEWTDLGNEGPWYVDRDGMLSLRFRASFEKGPGRAGVTADWGKQPLANFDIVKNSPEDKKNTGLALFRIFETQSKPDFCFAIKHNRQRGFGPEAFPEYETTIRLVVDALHQIALQDATMTGGHPVRIELIDENGHIVLFAE